MKVRTAALWAIVGMMGSSAAAMNVPALGRTQGPLGAPGPAEAKSSLPAAAQPRFHAEKTLAVDARLGHGSVGQGATGETFLLASISGADRADRAVAPMNLAIVIDRSGSMRGARLTNAIAAATGIVDRMRDGDRVTVVSFDDAAQVVVPPTLASATTRAGIEAAIRSIRAGGDTCVSCGLETAMQELDASRLAADDPGASSSAAAEIDRAILLSDGAANRGVRDASGLRRIAGRMRERGCAVTTIGLDVDFDEKVMAAIATESNGHHYFVADATDLARVFDRELDALLATVARDAELVIEPAAGVEIAEVFDRAFRRDGDRVVVPLGTFGAKQEKTALLRLRVPAEKVGVEPIVGVSLHWHDLVSRVDDGVASDLSLAVTPANEAVADLDPFVAARLERSRTARTLTDANLLFEQGKRDEARRTLEKTAAEIQANKAKATAVARHAPPAPKPAAAMPFADDFEAQLDAITSARSGFARQPSAAPSAVAGGGARGAIAAPSSPAAVPREVHEEKAAVKLNQSNATELGL